MEHMVSLRLTTRQKPSLQIEASDILIVSQNNNHTVRSSGPVLNFQGYLELRRRSIHISDQ